MWTPRSFRMNDRAILHDLIRAHPFGILVSAANGELVGTHLPFMIEPGGEHGTLVGHIARANTHWKTWTAETEVLVVFSGPHSYISPGWYADRVTVPTWNYAAAHAYGRPRLVQEPGELRRMVERLTRLYEPRSGGWSVDEAEPVMASELRAIVGFEIPIARLEGKWKFNQNRSREDQERVTQVLLRSPDPTQRAVGAIMHENLRRGGRASREGADAAADS